MIRFHTSIVKAEVVTTDNLQAICIREKWQQWCWCADYNKQVHASQGLTFLQEYFDWIMTIPR